ncbi:hypothetical protein K7432_010275 [Basidiobolus ranarum]|uniref:Major facilitator superfamily (MFS) profile domain-containing protein n=1 Tax=Basidiobolus ranarum TaxID=34480 RepID=A0ABR2VVR3_9FUNG
MSVLVYFAASAAAIGGFLFGYDMGAISGVLIMGPFEDRFGYAHNSFLEGFIVSSFVLGCFFGSLAASYLADHFGRKVSIIIGGAMFTIGGALQASSFEIGQLLVGRIVAGLAVGVLSMVVPLYQSEIAPKEIRGTLVSMQQLAISIGIFVSFLINLECVKIEGEASWRIPLGIQCIPAATLALVMLLLPKSPRWLISQGRTDEAMEVLCKFAPHPEEEMKEMHEAICLEQKMEKLSWSELLEPNLRRRVLIGVAIQAFQQLTGIIAVMYYAPTIFQSAGFVGSTAQLTATAINGAVNVFMAIPAVIYVDRLGRRPLLLFGAALMALTMVLVGALIAIFAPRNFDDKSAGYATIALIYMFVAFFTCTWGPIGWIYPSEIYSTRLRAKCMGVTTASNWAFNFIVALVVPPLINSISWGLYIMFGACDILMLLFVYFFIPETKGRSLEQIDHMFGGRVNVEEKVKFEMVC